MMARGTIPTASESAASVAQMSHGCGLNGFIRGLPRFAALRNGVRIMVPIDELMSSSQADADRERARKRWLGWCANWLLALAGAIAIIWVSVN